MYIPVRDLLLITMEKEEDKQTEAGVFIPKSRWNENRPIAIVEAVGELVEAFKVGDKVLINPYAVIDIQGEDKLSIIKQKDIIAHVG